MKVSELSNEQLDYWCAKAQELDGFPVMDGDHIAGYKIYCDPKDSTRRSDLRRSEWYYPSTNWQQAGKLVEKFKVDVNWFADNTWKSFCMTKHSVTVEQYADTPTRAICMAVIASVCGEEIGG